MRKQEQSLSMKVEQIKEQTMEFEVKQKDIPYMILHELEPLVEQK